MVELRIEATETGNLSNTQTDFSVDSEQTDGPADQKETIWENHEWTQQYGYYKNIPEIKAVIDAKARWTVGKGYTSSDTEEFILTQLRGIGIDTFNTILENQIRTYETGGDSYAEIIRDDKGNLINLKPLDPGAMIIVADRAGLIKRYEQKSKVKRPNKKFQPEEIFHLSLNRVADEIHGVSTIDALVTIILAKNEALADTKLLFHRHVKPMRVWKIDTDDTAKRNAFINEIDTATEKAENIFIPMNAAEQEIAAIPPNATLNPIPWLQYLDNTFYLVSGVPQIVLGGTGAITEAAVKIAYLAWQQTVEEEQLYIEEQVGMQLGIEINLEFPASLENELLSDKQKDGPENIDPSDTTAGAGQ